MTTPTIPSRALPRRYVQAGFYFALGILLLVLLALTARRFAEATLSVIGPFAVGLTLALLLDPMADTLMKRGLSRMASAGIVFGVFMFLILGISYLSIPALIAQAGNLTQNGPTYISGLQHTADVFLQTHRKIRAGEAAAELCRTDDPGGRVRRRAFCKKRAALSARF